MTLHEEQERVQRAVEHSLAGMKSDPWLTQRVLARAKGEEPVKKVSAALILVIALMLVTMAVGLGRGTGLLDDLFRGGRKAVRPASGICCKRERGAFGKGRIHSGNGSPCKQRQTVYGIFDHSGSARLGASAGRCRK